MKNITDILTSLTAEAFEKCGYDPKLGNVSVSDRLDLCQFQCNGAFAGAKLYHKAPFMIADEVAKELEKNPVFAKVEAVKPGFLNLTLTDEYLLNVANEIAADEFCGIPQAENPETIVIDYGGPNVAKPLHIGHLRSAIIGESLKRLARAAGHKVYGDIHLGDWGLQIGLVLAELQSRNPDWRCWQDDFDPETEKVQELDVDMLNEIYPFASKRSKEDETFRDFAHEMTVKLQSRNPGCIAVWKEIMRVSTADLKKNYERLNVDFDLWYGESDADDYIPELFNILEEKKLCRESEGALVVDVEEETDKAPMPPVIVRKSDHSSIYATTDLATLLQRSKDFNPDEIWYVVDKRQELHFTQVFRCARKAGIVSNDTKLSFLGFGTMNGSDGKPYKTRDGGVMRLSDLLSAAVNASAEKLSQSEFIGDGDTSGIAENVGIAAVKFGDLINHRSKDYIFDIDKFLSFEGKTGTYLLYTITRIHSILKKAGVAYDADLKLSCVNSDVERELLLRIMLTGETFLHALGEKSPNEICDNAYQLALLFSRFYHDSHILTEENEEIRTTWLALLVLVRKLLLRHLDVLGIESVEHM